MATISTLAVNLTAKTSVFDRKMKGSRRSLRGLTGDIARTQRMMMGFARTAMAAAGAYGLG